ncbi:RBP11-like subunits of RNA polymerase [Panaeolus papilionaceus]|nr:RBP11-like subunits of RNA polymerase [Panaeolus papilionaceus]
MASELPDKIKILKSSPDLSAATYQIHDESHTVGNALRWMLMKNPKVEFCGYSVPHPSEVVINVRIQMYALDDLDNLCETVEDRYLDSLRAQEYETWVEKF